MIQDSTYLMGWSHVCSWVYRD